MARQGKDKELARAVFDRIVQLQGKSESDGEFARRIGTTPQAFSNWRGGDNPSVAAIVRVVQSTSASALWLLTGTLPREAIPPAEADLRLALAKAAISATPEEIRGMLSATPSAGGRQGLDVPPTDPPPGRGKQKGKGSRARRKPA